MFSKTIVQALAVSALVSVGLAQDCPQNGPASSLFQSCGQVQGSMNVCTTGAVTSCSCSVLAHQSACYASYKENYCSNWNYQNDYFSANCGSNYADETATMSDKPASATASATKTSESSSEASATDASSSASKSRSSSTAASASASASSVASSTASASASRSSSKSASASASASSSSESSSSSASGSSASASGSSSSSAASRSSSASANGTPSASASATPSAPGNSAAGVFGVDGLIMGAGLIAALL